MWLKSSSFRLEIQEQTRTTVIYSESYANKYRIALAFIGGENILRQNSEGLLMLILWPNIEIISF